MRTPVCPFCNKIVALYRLQPMSPGTINPVGYDFNCEHCFYKRNGQDYLKFFGTCYFDMEFKYFVLREPLQNSEGVLTIEVMKDSYSVKISGATLVEKKDETLTPYDAQRYLSKVSKMIAFT